MFIRERWFETHPVMMSLPRLMAVGEEVRDNAAYCWAGKGRHNEQHCVFQYTLSGHGEFIDNNGCHRVGSGSGFLCYLNDPTVVYRYPEAGTDNWHFFYVCFDGPAVRAMVEDIVSMCGAIFQLPADGEMIRRLRELQERQAVSFLAPDQGARIVLDLLLILLGQRVVTTSEERIVQDFHRVVAQHATVGLSVSHFAKELGISPEHLSRVFRARTGEPPIAFLTRHRLIAACRLLVGGNQTVEAAAASSGFGSVSQLNRVCRAHTGKTPSAIRNRGFIPVIV